MLNICSAKFDFISGCVSVFICSVYRVLKDLPVNYKIRASRSLLEDTLFKQLKWYRHVKRKQRLLKIVMR